MTSPIRIYKKTVEAITAVLSEVRSPAGMHLLQFQLNRRKDPKVERVLRDAIAYMLSTGELLTQHDKADGEKWWLAERGVTIDNMDRQILCVSSKTTDAIRDTLFVLVGGDATEESNESPPETVEAVAPTPAVKPLSWDPDPDESCDKNILSFIRYMRDNSSVPGVSYPILESKFPDIKDNVLKLRLSVMRTKNIIEAIHLAGRPGMLLYIVNGTPCPIGYEFAAPPPARAKPKGAKKLLPVTPKPGDDDEDEVKVKPEVEVKEATVDNTSTESTDALPHNVLTDDIDVVWCIDSRGELACSDAVNDTWIVTLSAKHTAALSDFLRKTRALVHQPVETTQTKTP